LGGGIAEVIHIYLEELAGCPQSATNGDGINSHGVFNGIVGQHYGIVHKVLGEVPDGLHDCAEQGRALNPACLDHHWHHNLTWFTLGLRKGAYAKLWLSVLDKQVSESITDVQFQKQNVKICRRISHVVQQLG
jgi:hypothetical protein